jgi:hypothetical protein
MLLPSSGKKMDAADSSEMYQCLSLGSVIYSCKRHIKLTGQGEQNEYACTDDSGRRNKYFYHI